MPDGLPDRRLRSYGDFAQFYAQSFGDTLAISFISLQTIADVSDFDFLRCITDGASGVFKEYFLLCRTHQAEELSRLGIVIIIILTEIPVVSGTF